MGQQPQCGIYLLYVYFPFIVCRFGECQPPGTARFARLTARYEQFHSLSLCNFNRVNS